MGCPKDRDAPSAAQDREDFSEQAPEPVSGGSPPERPAAIAPRHPATEKAWEWFETSERALSFTPTLRASIEARLKELDSDLLDWDAVTS